MSTKEIPALQAFRRELVVAADQISDKRRLGVVHLAVGVSAVVVIAIALTIAGIGSGENASAAALTFSREDHSITVRIADLEASPEQFRQDLIAAGLSSITVTAAPTGPSGVGRFVALSSSAGAPELQPIDVAGSTYMGFRIPADFKGSIELMVGRAAHGGEAYVSGVDAYAPGEALSCRNLWGSRVADAQAQLAALGVRARWQRQSPSGEFEEVPAASIPDLFVTDALGVQDGVVLIYAAPTPDSLFVHPPSSERGRCQTSPPG